jgi:hypothetical protein
MESFKNLPNDSKAKFFGITALGNSLGASVLMEEFPELVPWLLKSVKSPTLAPHVSCIF